MIVEYIVEDYIPLLLQMLAKLRRIFGNDVVPAAKLNSQALISDIVKQARLERGARITKAVSELLDDVDGKCCWCASWDVYVAVTGRKRTLFRKLGFEIIAFKLYRLYSN